MPEWQFLVREDQIIEVDLGPEWSGFTEALNDAISTRAPRGDPEGLSTFWIDRTVAWLEAADSPRKELASGNATSLVLDGAFVLAQSEYELWPDEAMPRDEFLRGLELWRAETARRLKGHS